MWQNSHFEGKIPWRITLQLPYEPADDIIEGLVNNQGILVLRVLLIEFYKELYKKELQV